MHVETAKVVIEHHSAFDIELKIVLSKYHNFINCSCGADIIEIRVNLKINYWLIYWLENDDGKCYEGEIWAE